MVPAISTRIQTQRAFCHPFVHVQPSFMDSLLDANQWITLYVNMSTYYCRKKVCFTGLWRRGSARETAKQRSEERIATAEE
jgi:hypothetical protein